jgi:hypothetical protein
MYATGLRVRGGTGLDPKLATLPTARAMLTNDQLVTMCLAINGPASSPRVLDMQ